MVFNEAAAAPAVPGRLRQRGKVVKASAGEPKVGVRHRGAAPGAAEPREEECEGSRGKNPEHEIVNGPWMH